LKKRIELSVNGEIHHVDVAPNTTLLELLRSGLNLKGTKEGCGTGDCGSCIVLVGGRPVNSCLMLAMDARGREVTTIEGLAANGELDPVQQSFLEKGAFQCGFCTSAMILSVKALLDVKSDVDEGDVKQALSGVLCRCGSYPKIIEAAKNAAEKIKSR